MGSTVGSALVVLLMLLAEAAVVFSGVGLLAEGVGRGVQVETSSVSLSSLPRILGVAASGGEMETSPLPVLLVSGETEASLLSSLLILSSVSDLLLMGREKHGTARRINTSKYCSFILSDVQVIVAKIVFFE